MTVGDVFPRRNLPGQAEEWGRTLETRAVNAESQLSILSQELQGQNRNTASSLSVLSGQIQAIQEAQKDLLGREGHTIGDASSQTWTSSQPDDTAWGPTLEFTLTEDRVVSLQFMINADVFVLANDSATSVFAYIKGAIFVNGAMVGGARGDLGTNVGIATHAPRQSSLDGSIFCRSLITLPAGDHTMQGGFETRSVQVIGPDGSGEVGASNPQLFVDVLQQTN